jgi:hypothetical protein
MHGQIDDAINNFSKALLLDPNYRMAQVNLKKVLRIEKKFR